MGGTLLKWSDGLTRSTEETYARWPGLDQPWMEAAMAAGRTRAGQAIRKELGERFMYGPGKPFLVGPPMAVAAAYEAPFHRLVRAYHRAIETVVQAHSRDERVREVVSSPPGLADDIQADGRPANGRVHLCRLDLMVDPDGGYWVLETNANCPGGFIFSGALNVRWRDFLAQQGLEVPGALRHEEDNFMARWFLEVAEEETGVRPDFVALLREDGGNRLEMDLLAEALRREGVDAVEADPRELEEGPGGQLVLRGRPVTHAYLKLGIQAFVRLRSELDLFVAAVGDGRLWVQNGQRGRWVGDNKLCLAVVSDPRFEDLFDADDLAFVRDHIPWSRNVGLLAGDELEAVRRNRTGHVLKRPMDTRGRGVVVGHDCTEDEWAAAVKVARAERWLVQGFHETTEVERNFRGGALNRHDLALGAINGQLTTIFSRSSPELRVNMARSGRMHPVFLGS
jgi:hypothetical protein